MVKGEHAEFGWLYRDGHVAEYQAARAAWTLEMPPGVAIPVEPPPEPEPGTLYQIGAGEVAVLFHWLYAVERAAVEAHRGGDATEAQRWVEVAAKHVETATFAKYNDPDVPISWFESIIIPARAGDFNPICEDVDNYFAVPMDGSRYV